MCGLQYAVNILLLAEENPLCSSYYGIIMMTSIISSNNLPQGSELTQITIFGFQLHLNEIYVCINMLNILNCIDHERYLNKDVALDQITIEPVDVAEKLINLN